MGIDELMDLTMYSSMYLLFAMAAFYVEGANLLVPSRVNANFKRILSPFTSFFKGFIGAGGWSFVVHRKLNDETICGAGGLISFAFRQGRFQAAVG